MNEAEERKKQDMGSYSRARKAMNRINRVSAVLSIILLAFVITNTLAPSLLTLPIPPIISWYVLGFSFFLWFATRKGGCGSCNQGTCS